MDSSVDCTDSMAEIFHPRLRNAGCRATPSRAQGPSVKVPLARRLRGETTASLKWIAKTISMVAWTRVANLLRPARPPQKSVKDKDRPLPTTTTPSDDETRIHLLVPMCNLGSTHFSVLSSDTYGAVSKGAVACGPLQFSILRFVRAFGEVRLRNADSASLRIRDREPNE